MANVLRSIVSYILSSFSVVSGWRIDLVLDTPSWLEAGFLTPTLTRSSSNYSKLQPPTAAPLPHHCHHALFFFSFKSLDLWFFCFWFWKWVCLRKSLYCVCFLFLSFCGTVCYRILKHFRGAQMAFTNFSSAIRMPKRIKRHLGGMDEVENTISFQAEFYFWCP